MIKRETLIVGLNGQARGGKDTTAQILIDLLQHHNAFAQKVSFAAPLKQMYIAAWQYANAQSELAREMADSWLSRIISLVGSLRDEQIPDAVRWLTNLPGLTPEVLRVPYLDNNADMANKELHRRNLIDIGMYFRSLDPDFWVKQAISQIEPTAHFAFIPDMRFDNEVFACDFKVRVVRPDIPLVYNTDHTEVDRSEIYSITGKYDWLVDNSGTIDDLVRESAALLDELFIQRVIKIHRQVS